MTGGLQHVVDVVVDSTRRTVTSAPPTDQYLSWDADGVEVPVPDEEAKINELKEVMSRMQKHNFDKHRHAFRATHVKTQGVVKGKLIVKSDLPSHLQQGIFSTPGKVYQVAARYANEPYLLQDDREPGPRGMAMKVFGVNGDRLSGNNQDENPHTTTTTQDFFFNNAPMIELTDLDTCLDIMKLRETHFDNPTALGLALSLRTDSIKQHAPYTLPNTNIISQAMYTQSAFRFGKYYGHMGLFPIPLSSSSSSSSSSTTQTSLSSDEVLKSDPPTILSDKLSDFFFSSTNPAIYEFRIQLATSTLHHPTEDASVVWDESTAPYQTLGTVEFPPQNSFDHKRRVFWEERMRLSPWAGVVDHTPLGSINRLRKEVYYTSREVREGVNCSAVAGGDGDSGDSGDGGDGGDGGGGGDGGDKGEGKEGNVDVDVEFDDIP